MSRLNDFLCELLQAVDQYIADGERDDNCPEWFNPGCGICDNWSDYTDARQINREGWKMGKAGLAAKFARDNLCDLTPFNSSLSDYSFEAQQWEIWNNARRLDWLRYEVKRIQAKRAAA